MPYLVSPHYTTADPILSALLSSLSQDVHLHPHSQPQQPQNAPQPAAKKPYKPTNRSIRAFTPNFDVLETQSSYILEGELPGLSNKRAIDIEFTDDRTLLIRGRVEKTKRKEEKDGGEDNNKRRSLNPTVEDTTDDEDEYTVVKTKEQQQQAATTTSEEKTKEEQGYKAWVSERTFGNFQRSFSFPTPVDVEGVKAELEAGVLTISVPKRVAKAAKRIEIQ